MNRLGRGLADARTLVAFRLRVLQTKALEALAHWLDPLAGTDEVRYRTARDLLFDEVTEGFADPSSRFYVPPWEVPDDSEIEPIVYTPEQATRRDHIRSALIAEAGRVHGKRQRRRQVRRHRIAAFACVVMLTACVLTAGASAVLTGSTGSEAIDAFLSLHAAHDDDSSPATVANPGPGGDTRPSLDSASKPVTVPLDAGGRPVVGVSYVSNDGRLCSVLQVSRPADAHMIVNLLGCVQPTIAYTRVAAAPATVIGTQASSSSFILYGYTRPDVETVRVRGPVDSFSVSLSDPWTPNTPGAAELRPFYAASSGAFGRDGLRAEEERVVNDLRRYQLTVTYDDGHTERVSAWPTP